MTEFIYDAYTPELAGETLVFVNRYYIQREGKPDVHLHITVNI